MTKNNFENDMPEGNSYLEKLGKNLFIIALIIIFSSILTLVIFDVFILKNWTERGTFGDTFGFLNAIFSGLAFGGILYTILLQREELKDQRLELLYTRRELEGQKDQLILQKVENHFFNLLRLRNELIQSMVDREKNLHGQEIIETALFEFRDEYNKALNSSEDSMEIREYFFIMHERYYENLDPYFRNLFNIIEFIDESEDIQNNRDKRLYMDTLKAQLSNPEVIMLSYFGIFIIDNEQYKQYFEKYHVLENIILNDAMDDVELIKAHYPHLKEILKPGKVTNKFMG
jgi:hypothetical protein